MSSAFFVYPLIGGRNFFAAVVQRSECLCESTKIPSSGLKRCNPLREITCRCEREQEVAGSNPVRRIMPGETTSGDTIFESGGEKSEEQNDSESSGDVPIFANGDQAVAVWANEDKNGDYYLSVRLPLGLATVNLFTQDEFKEAFNSFVEHIKENE